MISFGMPAGPNTAYHWSTANPGTPASAMVGRSGTDGDRLALDTANARSRPARTCGMVEIALAEVTETRPATRSRMLGAVPLYGICTNCRPAIRLSSSIARCCPLPEPDEIGRAH